VTATNRPDPGNCHEPSTNCVTLGDRQHHLVKLRQGPQAFFVSDEQRFRHGRDCLVVDRLANALGEQRVLSASGANAKGFQRAPHGVDQIPVAANHRLAMTQKQSDALAVIPLRMGDLEQTSPHRLRDQSRVQPVRLDRRGFCEGLHLPDLNADDGKPTFGKSAEKLVVRVKRLEPPQSAQALELIQQA
jgi:hypothetical protein